MQSRDDLQRRAIRLYERHYRILKAAKNAGQPERSELKRMASDSYQDAKKAFDAFFGWKP